jgi:hypothetical protein
MILSPEKLAHDANALAWSLLTPRPDYADGALATEIALAHYQAGAGQLIAPHWVRLQNREHVGYIEIKNEVSGRYLGTLPAEIDPSSVVDVKVDRYLGTTSALLAQLIELVASLAAGRQPKICSTGEMIQFGAVGSGYWERLNTQLRHLQEATAPGYNPSVIAAWSERLQTPLLQMFVSHSIGAVREGIEDLARAVAELRATYAADGTLSAWAMIFGDLCRKIEAASHPTGDDAAQTAATYIRYVAFGAAGGVLDPVGLTLGLIDKAAREGFHQVAAAIGDRYLEEGDDLIDQALEARTLEEFGKALYRAGPLLFGATRIFKGLIDGKRVRVPKAATTKYAKRANVAEEHAVRVNASLLNMLQNRTGARWQQHQARVAEAEAAGDAGARQEIFRIIELNYFYPRCWETCLRGPTSALPPLTCA